MTTGQVPKKSGYSPIEQLRVVGARVVQYAYYAFAVAMLGSAIAARPASAAQDATTLHGAPRSTEIQIAQDVVVPPVKRQRPIEGGTSVPETEPETAAPETAAPTPQSAAEAEQPTGPDIGIFGAIQDWLARANREYQGIVVKELSSPSTGPGFGQSGDDPIARKLAEQQQEEARAAAEKAADDARAVEAKRLADDRRRAEETKRLADEASRKADEILKDATSTQTAEQQRREAQKLADENRRQEEQRQAAENRRAEAERKRVAAAEAARKEAALADEAAQSEAARQDAERRRVEAAAQDQKHRRRTIVLTTEPIERPSDHGTLNRPELASEQVMADNRYVAYRPMIVDRPHNGTAVKRWVRRIDVKPQRCHAAGRRVVVPGRYVIKRGDSLWRISKRHYHKGKFYKRIYAANRRSIRDPDLIYPCQRVFVPRKRR